MVPAPRERPEIALTAAQSLFALALLMNLEFALGEALALFLLFITQIFFPQAAARWAFAGVYLAGAFVLIVGGAQRRAQIAKVVRYTLAG